MDDSLHSKDEAQERADQIAAFRAEILELEREGVSAFTPEQLAAIRSHHDALLARLVQDFDIDRTVAERRMSLGMRLASAFGAATLTAAVISFVYQIWGAIPTGGQVVLLTAAPVIGVTATVVAGHMERTRYVAAVMAVVACGAFVLQTVLMGQIFNLHGTPHSLFLWGVFAMAVAVPWRFALPFGLGVLSIVCYLAALSLWVAGAQGTDFLQRPETIMLAALVMLAAARYAPRELVVPARSVSLVLFLGPLLLLSAVRDVSLLPIDPSSVRVWYQALAAVAIVAVIVIGVKRSLDEVILIGAMSGGVFLLTRFVDWWWDWMPRYVFFLILAAVALAWIWALRILRRHAAVRGVR